MATGLGSCGAPGWPEPARPSLGTALGCVPSLGITPRAARPTVLGVLWETPLALRIVSPAKMFRFCFPMASEKVLVGELAGQREVISGCGP